ncbi:MAG: hypothetical protein NTX43_08290 [Bacteroidetes bacterium]|nr:hypothetical protein [Bacteroidota bacterium]
MAIQIKPVKTRTDLSRFIKFPYSLYKGNKYWCPPMRMDERNTLSPKKNPAFDFCEAQYFLAYKGKELVGRVAGIINHASNTRWNEKLVRFGWIDFTDDPEVSGALIDAVTAWGKEKGMIGIHGPLGFSDMDNEGMLIEGFEELATMASIYNYPYYMEHMQKMGFERAADWVQYEFEMPPIPEKIHRAAGLIARKYNLRVLQAKKAKDFLAYAPKMWATLNEAFDNLYGYTKLTQKQTVLYTKQYFPFINPDYVCMVLNEHDDVAGFGICLPSLTRALQKCNGRLFPFGWYHIMRALKSNEIIDMYLNGVKPEYQNKGVVSIYHLELHKGFLKNNVKYVVTNPQLEDNKSAVLMWKSYETARQHLKRRCWIKHFNEH